MEHPEARNGEVFVGNTSQISEDIANLPTARLGTQAYNIKGEKIRSADIRPLFVGASDYAEYNRIMERKFKKIHDEYLSKARMGSGERASQ